MRKQNILLSIVALLILGVAILWIHNVDNEITESDKIFIQKILTENQIAPVAANPGFDEEIAYIQKVQLAVLKLAPSNRPLPEGQPREPEDLYKANSGMCFDRSRVIEKILRYSGFKTRHVSIFSLQKTDSKVKALLSGSTKSHAMSEVLTSKGWVFVDSNYRFIGLTQDTIPASMAYLQEHGLHQVKWTGYNQIPTRGAYQHPFIYIFGLYSRHGEFYAPFNFIPDLNWGELLQNF